MRGITGKSKAKAALAKTNSIEVSISGEYEDDRQKFHSLYSFLGTVYSGNSVSSMAIDDRVDALEYSDSQINSRISTLENRDVQLFNGDSMVVSDVTTENTISETTIFSSIIPAGFISSPTMMELEISGVYSTANSSDSFTVRIKLNGLTVHSFISVPKNVTDTPVEIVGRTTIRTIGATGSYVTKTNFSAYNDSLFSSSINSGTIDTTVENTIEVTMQWDNADVGNTGTVQQGIIKMNKNQG